MRKKYNKILFIAALGAMILMGCTLNTKPEVESVFQPLMPTEGVRVTPALENTEAFNTVVTDLPTPTEVPSVTNEPTPTEVPSVTEAPTPTEVPVVTEKPTPTPTGIPVSTGKGKDLYLTFDDGPSPKFTLPLLDVLDRYQVKATFFVCGTNQPQLIKEIHDRGHVVGIHSVTHNYRQIYANEKAFFDDLYTMQEFIYECTGERTMLLRFPGGSSNTVSNFNPGIMSRLAKQVEEEGFRYFDWNVSTEDSSTDDINVMTDNVERYSKAQPHIILLHHPENEQSSLEAVEALILWGIKNECKFKVLGPDAPKMHHKIAN